MAFQVMQVTELKAADESSAAEEKQAGFSFLRRPRAVCFLAVAGQRARRVLAASLGDLFRFSKMDG